MPRTPGDFMNYSPVPGPMTTDLVEVRFDGACVKAPDGTSRLYGYGYRARGAGFDLSYSHAVITGRLVQLVASLVGFDEGAAAEMPSVIRSIQVADLEAALCALADLRKSGYHGRVRLLGDCQPMIDRLRSGAEIRPGAADAPAIAYRESLAREISNDFESVEWAWIRREENGEADALAWKAVHDVIEYKKHVLKSARQHPDRGPFVPVAEALARALIPGDIDEREIDQMQCLCRTCRPDRLDDSDEL